MVDVIVGHCKNDGRKNSKCSLLAVKMVAVKWQSWYISRKQVAMPTKHINYIITAYTCPLYTLTK